MQTTICGKIKDTAFSPALAAAAKHLDRVERFYIREVFAKDGECNKIKRDFLKKSGINGRQLNGIIFNLKGKVDANKKNVARNQEKLMDAHE